MPARSGERDGEEVKKVCVSRPEPAMARPTINAARGNMPTNVESRPRMANMPSMRLRRDTLFSRSFTSVDLPEALAEQVTGDIENQGHRHQGQTGCENALIGDGAVRQVTKTDLNDVGGDRGRPLHGVERQVGLLARRDCNHHG